MRKFIGKKQLEKSTYYPEIIVVSGQSNGFGTTTCDCALISRNLHRTNTAYVGEVVDESNLGLRHMSHVCIADQQCMSSPLVDLIGGSCPNNIANMK
jgi:hypothetical protein